MAFEVRQGFVLDYLSSDFWLAAGEIQTGAAAYLARKRAQQKAAEKEKEKDLAAAEIQTSSAALLANLRARKEAEEPAVDEGEGEEGDADHVPDSSRAYTRHGRAVQAKARMAKDAAQKKAAGETDAVENPLMQLLRRLRDRVAWSPSTSLRSKDYVDWTRR
jgi:hypothetical protein